MALIGLALALAATLLVTRPDLREDATQKLLGWLQQGQPVDATETGESIEALDPADRATAANPRSLPKEQAQVAAWISRKYRVAPEPVSALVSEAFQLGRHIKIDPTLILAVMAIESRFNPFAQSPVGAQGLMQVLTRVHTDKYENFGGKHAAFDPVTNLRVGVKVLQDCIRSAGSIEGGLRLYVGAVSTDGSDYVNKVIAEQQKLRLAARGGKPPVSDAPAVVKARPAPPPQPLLDAEAEPAPAPLRQS